MSSAQPEHITRWRDKKAETSKPQANKQLSLLRMIFQHASLAMAKHYDYSIPDAPSH